MTLNLTVSPDFSPDRIGSWYLFNTWLQRRLGIAIHLDLYDGFAQQRRAIAHDGVDLIYANPYDAAMLVRDKGFTAVARPVGVHDEAIIAVAAAHPARCVEDLAAGLRVATTDDPDVRLMGLILLEPADIGPNTMTTVPCGSYVLVAKQLLAGQADAGIFLADAYDRLSTMVRNGLRPLVRSEISVVHHALLAGPRAAAHIPALAATLLTMAEDDRGAGILGELGLQSWAALGQEDVEFMIDLMDTLIG